VAERERVGVPAAAAGERLDRFLATALGSRARAQRHIEAGLVTVDGGAQPARHRLAGGETIAIAQEPPRARAEDDTEPASYIIRYEDPHLLVVDKPAGVVVHPARGHRGGTLAQALAGRTAGGADPARAGIVHRLDRDTSGLLVVARSENVHRALRGLIATRALERRYSALVEGHPPAKSGTIDAPLGRDRRRRTLISTDTDCPRQARTHFELARMLPTATLLEVRLETGRTHQIRAHLRAIGHPVAGDPDYGTPGLFGLPRQFLHATSLRFPHPVSGEEIYVESPLPDDLASALDVAARKL